MMEKNTFDNHETYKALVAVNNMLENIQNPYMRAKISRLIIRFNIITKELLSIKKDNIREYLIGFVRNDYSNKIRDLRGIYDEILLNHIANYIHAKLKSVLKGKVETSKK